MSRGRYVRTPAVDEHDIKQDILLYLMEHTDCFDVSLANVPLERLLKVARHHGWTQNRSDSTAKRFRREIPMLDAKLEFLHATECGHYGRTRTSSPQTSDEWTGGSYVGGWAAHVPWDSPVEDEVMEKLEPGASTWATQILDAAQDGDDVMLACLLADLTDEQRRNALEHLGLERPEWFKALVPAEQVSRATRYRRAKRAGVSRPHGGSPPGAGRRKGRYAQPS